LRGIARVAYRRFGKALDSGVELRISGRQHLSSCPSNDPSNINSGILVVSEDILPRLSVVKK
jgi:hypothetical protein